MTKVLVDTCIWSQALRRKLPNSQSVLSTDTLIELVSNGMVAIIGPIRQELLSGISDTTHFNNLKKKLSAFDDIQLRTEHFIKAAEFSNICRRNGVQGSSTDFLICVVSVIENLIIFTTDQDFNHYQKYLPVKLL